MIFTHFWNDKPIASRKKSALTMNCLLVNNVNVVKRVCTAASVSMELARD